MQPVSADVVVYNDDGRGKNDNVVQKVRDDSLNSMPSEREQNVEQEMRKENEGELRQQETEDKVEEKDKMEEMQENKEEGIIRSKEDEEQKVEVQKQQEAQNSAAGERIEKVGDVSEPDLNDDGKFEEETVQEKSPLMLDETNGKQGSPGRDTTLEFLQQDKVDQKLERDGSGFEGGDGNMGEEEEVQGAEQGREELDEYEMLQAIPEDIVTALISIVRLIEEKDLGQDEVFQMLDCDGDGEISVDDLLAVSERNQLRLDVEPLQQFHDWMRRDAEKIDSDEWAEVLVRVDRLRLLAQSREQEQEQEQELTCADGEE
eukprot:298937-Hanusia_phi.AAC.1